MAQNRRECRITVYMRKASLASKSSQSLGKSRRNQRRTINQLKESHTQSKTYLVGVEKDENDDKDGDPVKVPKRRLSTRFSFLAVWALFLVF
jgi:hypothetical protein